MNLRSATLIGVLLSASCAPSSPPEPSVTLGFAAGTSNTPEGVSESVTIQLDLVGYAALEEELTVVVQDAGTGTAQSGTDYVGFTSSTLVFPEGSPTGTTRSVNVAPLDDNGFEGSNETVELVLTNLTGPATLGTAAHSVELEESNVPTLSFAIAASATPDESTNSYTVNIELSLDSGDVLDIPVSVMISDSGAGSATAGIDYTITNGGLLTFASGTSVTQTHTVTFNVIDDATSEGDETIVLALVNPTNGLMLAASTTHVLTITEDDIPVAAALAVRLVDGATTTVLGSTDTVALGSDTIGGSSGTELTLELANLGSLPLMVTPLDFAGHVDDFRVELNQPPAASPAPPVESLFPLLGVGEDALQGTVLETLEVALNALGSSENVLLHGVPLPAGNTAREALGPFATLRLKRLDSPVTSATVIHVDGVQVPTESVTSDLSLWRGDVVGVEGSHAFLAFSASGSRGWIQTGSGLDDTLHLVSEKLSSGVVSSRLVTEGLMDAQRIEQHAGCGGVLYPPGSPLSDEQPFGPEGLPETAGAPSVSVLTSECTIAIETDYQLFVKFSGATELTDYVTELVAAVSSQYEEDVQAKLTIAYLGIHTTSDDGWTTQETLGAGTAALLAEFRADWGGNFPVQADLAHFLSGANLGGGIAYVGTLCSQSFGFGVSANINGFINWTSFNGSASPLNWDFVVFAHELGHNFGATHTHSYCPPLDGCYANCNGMTGCESSTLMSYCHTCSGGLNNVQLRFHPRNADVMRARINTSCLADWEIGGGGAASFRLIFDPVTDAGARLSTLDFRHDAGNLPSPFFLDLTGTAVQ